MSANNSTDPIEPFPTDGEERDYEAAVEEIGLGRGSVFEIHDHVFEYRGMSYGEATVFRLSDPMRRDTEGIPLPELWEAYQRGDLEIGKWQCQFIADND